MTNELLKGLQNALKITAFSRNRLILKGVVLFFIADQRVGAVLA